MLKYGGGEEKLYINSLCVSGSSIKLLNPTNKCYINKTIKITLDADADERENFTERYKTKEATKIDKVKRRQTLNLNVTDYKNSQVCSKQLKQIHETVKIKDFERILNNLPRSDVSQQLVPNKVDRILRKIDADDIYDEFFGRYYNYLYELIESS
ncbi:uncharacterized protein LOC130895368 [Diorhabda carinulata]|uniref:uncharacterized protein LOC130447244 n=1 Tax=Diorhabda sublineata TaxID=1163346 RepID=UPI0024E16D42|nr:uncharacterized protein LOC130447244 [Diorhabda sublineata]XP_057658589.1 uncharacterized protein LOC130895368 [Diorhabda carinulata]